MDRLGLVGLVWSGCWGEVRSGSVRYGAVRQLRHGAVRMGRLWYGCCGAVRNGIERFGAVRCGSAVRDRKGLVRYSAVR